MFGLDLMTWSGYLEKVSIKRPVHTIFFSNSRSPERPGLIIETLEYVICKAMDPDFNFRQKVDYQKLLGSLLYKSTIQYITCVLKLHGSPDLVAVAWFMHILDEEGYLCKP